MIQKINDALKNLGAAKEFAPSVGIILGTGLGGLAGKITEKQSISYSEIEGFPHSTVESHAGHLTWGYLGDTKVVTMEGRFHYYEGYSVDEITFPVRVMKALGIHTLVVSNASGGLNPQYEQGDIVIIEDHINLMGINPLIGPNDDSLGNRFPDMIEPYNKGLIEIAEQCALNRGIKTHRGVYSAVSGPNLETRAEYRYLRTIGADLVGMSTIPEVIVAVHAKLNVLGLSCATDLCFPDALKPVNIDEIIATAQKAEPKMCEIVTDVLAKIKP